nr:2-oxoacid:acceptor oxidoreductase family protein [uncultured Acetatifactor sp.]
MPDKMKKIQRITQTMDGNQAAAHVAYAYSETAAIYPITPSSPMAELCDEWAGAGRKNIYGLTPVISQLQSEAGAAGAVHGALLAGSLAVTFTASQGLLLMLPNLYRIAGELLPGVVHVAARTIATHALSIFGDHSDVYACRQTGMAIFSESSVQEVMDLSPAAHLAAVEGRIPFLNFFDGFRTSHELHKIQVWDYETLKEMLDRNAVERFRTGSLHPSHGKVYGSAQNPDIFFQAREASNPCYQALPEIVERQLTKINSRLGTHYGLFDYYGAPEAEHVIIAMGSVCETIKEYIDSVPDHRYGLIVVHLYRPFSGRHLVEKLPGSVRQITVLDRTKEPGAPGEPLYLDVVAALTGCGIPVSGTAQTKAAASCIRIFSGRYGLSSKDTTPAQIAAVYENHSQTPFTVGILDDVTHLSLNVPDLQDTAPADIISCKFWGLGGDGTVSATKNAVKIIGSHTDMTIQGYFEYDSKKSRGLTISHLRFGKSPVRSAYLIHRADFVACHNPVYLHKYQMVQELKDGGTFLLNYHFRQTASRLQRDREQSGATKGRTEQATEQIRELESYLPKSMKAYLAEHHIRLFVIDALGIGKEIGLNSKISTILQAAFFAVSGLLESEKAKQWMVEAAEKSYGKSGGNILEMNRQAIERGLTEVIEVKVPEGWRHSADDPDAAAALDNTPLPDRPEMMDFVRHIQQPVTDQRGDSLPVSAFLPYADGYTPPGSTAHERRGVATEIPVWKPENCIQCTRCSYVCPHAVIRPAALTEEQLADAPEGMKSLPMFGMEGYSFAITVSRTDCTGCGTCAAICPGRPKKPGEEPSKALEMVPVTKLEDGEDSSDAQAVFDYCKPLLPCKEAADKFRPDTLKGSQFLRPLLEFSGACAGCGETAYVKLLTQLFGSRMYIANATGCSSIWGNSAPSCAYALDGQGHGPAWSNSLFEDAAEFGYGMLMAREAADRRSADGHRDTLSDTIQWIVGGDGWAYDIGFSGLDHVLASGKNINILVLDTEVYSNTGGQASKATPIGSTAKFAVGGKQTAKKDLASMAMTYGNIYVAQVALGADLNQTIRAITEAAAYPGPSLVIAYATCIAHGIRAGMGSTPHEAKKAVDAGYFHLFRFHPALREQNKNPFILDSGEPKLDYNEFLEGEIRYGALKRSRPEEAEALFRKAAAQAKKKYQYLKGLEALYAPEPGESPDAQQHL